MKLSLIIVAYKKPDILDECLSSIDKYNNLDKDLEVIVVDNSPKEERVSNVVEKYGYRYIPSENKGFGYGNNRGAEVATGEYLGFVNPDIIFIEPVFKRIVDALEKEEVGILGCKLLNRDLKSNVSFNYVYPTSVFAFIKSHFYNKHDIFKRKKMYTSGADLFISKKLFDSLGGFDEHYFMYYEENDLKERMKISYPSKLWSYDKNIKMIHLEGQMTVRNRKQKLIELESLSYFSRKYNYDLKKKMKFDIRYLSLKSLLFGTLNKERGKVYKNDLDVIKEEFSKLYGGAK